MGTRRAIAVIVTILAIAGIGLATGRLDLGGDGSDPVFVLVPMDGASEETAARVARRLGRAYDIPVEVADRLRSEDLAVDPNRGQLDAGLLVEQLARHRAAHPGSAVVGVTDGDIYWSGRPDWQFTFGVVDDGGHGVISTARMDPRNYGLAGDDKAVERRLTAMMARYLTRLAFDLQPNAADPRSVMRDSVLELADLDEMTPWVCPGRPGLRRPC